VNLTSFRFAVKQHQFEVAAGTLAALLVAVAALVVNANLRGVDVPADCFRAWRETFDAPEACRPALAAFGRIDEEQAGRVFAAMAVLPFLLGLLGGVPIVGQELEARTAQMAWSLTASRPRWLLRQALPIILVLGVAIILAAFAADILETTRQLRSRSAVNDMTLHGAVVVGRAYAAFGSGLLLGALVGRTLPALVLGTVVSLALVAGMEDARRIWVGGHAPVPVDVGSGGTPAWAGSSFGVVWITPEGQQISDAEAVERVPLDVPDTNQWLLDRGYRMAELVISEETVLGWRTYDLAAFAATGSIALIAAGVVVNRRRPMP